MASTQRLDSTGHSTERSKDMAMPMPPARNKDMARDDASRKVGGACFYCGTDEKWSI